MGLETADRQEKGSRAQGTGSHVVWGGKPLTSWEKGSRAQATGSHVVWKGKPLTTMGSESKVQIRHRGEVGTDKEDAMLEKKRFLFQTGCNKWVLDAMVEV